MDSEATASTPVTGPKASVGEAVQEIFHAVCGLDTEMELSEAGMETHEPLIVGVISIVGGLEWSLFLSLPRSVACAAAARFAGFDIDFDSADMGDAVGELTNIIIGRVKAKLDAKGIRVDISLPTVVRAQSLDVLAQRSLGTCMMSFATECGAFEVGVISAS